MAKTVDEAFSTLIGWLSPTSTETQTAISHRGSIEARLKADFGLTSFFRSGSFGHHTSVSGHSDVDYFAVIPSINLSANSTTALQSVRSSLAARFPYTAVTVRSPAVVVPFGTSASERHEIAPAKFVKRSDDGYSVYDIPDRGTGWMRSSPTAHNAWVNTQNIRLSSKVKPLIRLLKAWNYKQSVGIRSFYLELRTTQYCANESTIIYTIDFLAVLRRLRAHTLASMQDPVGISGYVQPCTDAWKATALSRIDTAITRAEKAREAETAGNISNAYTWWSMVFNGYFPSY